MFSNCFSRGFFSICSFLDQVGLVSWLIITCLELEQKTHGSTSDQTTPKSFFHNAGDKISEEWQIKYVKLTN